GATLPIATITGTPRSPTPLNTALMRVGGAGVTQYRFKLNDGAFTAAVPAETPMTLEALANGTNTVAVIGGNADGVFQSESSATLVQWIINSALPAVRLNEILASRSGSLPDQIELYNEGTATVQLGLLGLSDEAGSLNKFKFAAGTTLAPGAY